jgi:hypothetical protein
MNGAVPIPEEMVTEILPNKNKNINTPGWLEGRASATAPV